MQEDEVKSILSQKLHFSNDQIENLDTFCQELIKFNKSYNLISNSTVPNIWSRHVLDSAQIIKHINFDNSGSLSDLGTGAGLPGMVIAIYNKNPNFHVKLYEKSKVKCQFLMKVANILGIKVEIINQNVNNIEIYTEYVVCRAYKKLEEIMKVSRERIKVNHRLIILKGKSAENEIKMLSEKLEYRYELIGSITNKESKIILIDIKK